MFPFFDQEIAIMELNSIRSEEISTMSPEDESDVKLRYYINIARNNESKSKLLQKQLVDAQITIRNLLTEKDSVPFSNNDHNRNFDSLGRPQLFGNYEDQNPQFNKQKDFGFPVDQIIHAAEVLQKDFYLDSNLDFETNRELLEPEQTEKDLFSGIENDLIDSTSDAEKALDHLYKTKSQLPPISCDGYSVSEIPFSDDLEKIELSGTIDLSFIKTRPTEFKLSPILADKDFPLQIPFGLFYCGTCFKPSPFGQRSCACVSAKYFDDVAEIAEKQLKKSIDEISKSREQLNNEAYRVLFPDGFRPKRMNIFRRFYNWCAFQFEKLKAWEDDPRIQK